MTTATLSDQGKISAGCRGVREPCTELGTALQLLFATALAYRCSVDGGCPASSCQVCRGAVGRSAKARFIRFTNLAKRMRTGVAVVAVLVTLLAGKVSQGDAW